MNQTDIKEILAMLTDAIETNDWEIVEDAKIQLQEFLDEHIETKEDI